MCRAKLKAVRHSLTEEDIDALAAATHGFVGADLAAICQEAAMAALRRVIAARQSPSAPHQPTIKQWKPQKQTSADNMSKKSGLPQGRAPYSPQSTQAAAESSNADAGRSQQQSAPEVLLQATQQQPTTAEQAAVVPAEATGQAGSQAASCDSSPGYLGSGMPEAIDQMKVRVCANAAESSEENGVPPFSGRASSAAQSSSAQAGHAEVQALGAEPQAGKADLQAGKAAGQAGQAGLEITQADFKVAETRVRPSAMREVALEVPKVRWGDVGGLDGVKQRLQEAVQWPHLHPEALARLGAQPPKGEPPSSSADVSPDQLQSYLDGPGVSSCQLVHSLLVSHKTVKVTHTTEGGFCQTMPKAGLEWLLPLEYSHYLRTVLGMHTVAASYTLKSLKTTCQSLPSGVCVLPVGLSWW